MRVAATGAAYFVIIRLSTVTHSINLDQRRIVLANTKITATSYDLQVPADKSIVTLGYYYLFAMSSRDVPSIAKIVRISSI